ncbi:hypothetical protein PUN28_015275 [Cardiocondyla obscurior]|uniref:Uncharacterized protein n=1 Tax=Cardiocondyla obscurior TaxID=286306 RepID=A0AAW2F1K1_9HYME
MQKGLYPDSDSDYDGNIILGPSCSIFGEKERHWCSLCARTHSWSENSKSLFIDGDQGARFKSGRTQNGGRVVCKTTRSEWK